MIKVKNIYYMLSYVFKNLQQQDYANMMLEDFEHAEDLLAAILIKGMSRQIKKGLGKSYIQNVEPLGTIRGKIDITASIKRQTQHQNKLVCIYDEFSENIYLNQILKSTSLKLLCSKDVLLERKKKLKKLICYLGHIEEIDLRQVRWAHIRYDRNNAEYKMLMHICQLIVSHQLLTKENGNKKLPNYIDDQKMHQLYERFVREYYRYHYPQLKVSAATVDWALDNGVSDYLPTMKTDITIEYQDKVLIIDTKYYGRILQSHGMYDKQTIHSGNLYQIYTYVKNKDRDKTGKVSGVLLYAKTDEEIVPDQSYQMDGNKISVKTLDLNVEFEEIKRQLDQLVRIEILGG